MPAKTASKATDSSKNKGNRNFVDDYLADWDDDPFRSLSPEPAKQDAEKGKKKDVLGVDTELDLKKKPRVPRVKLDDARLLSDKGIPKLRKTAPRLKLKGKGHEFSDAARLLSFYQEWLDDLFPKATFLDALAMVEKTGHKTTIRNERLKWIDESKPKVADPFDDEDNRIHTSDTRQGEGVAPIFENAAAAGRDRAKSPGGDSLFGDDIYSATPRRNASGAAPPGEVVDSGIPDDDDLDALMAEAEADSGPSRPAGSIFGNGGPRAVVPATGGVPDDDDFDALMAEAEAEEASRPPAGKPTPSTEGASIFGNGLPKQQAAPAPEDDYDDLDALMAEVEAEREMRPVAQTQKLPSQTTAAKPATEPAKKSSDFEDGDDLDTLMAEAEAEGGSTPDAGESPSVPANTAPQTASNNDEAEMDGCGKAQVPPNI